MLSSKTRIEFAKPRDVAAMARMSRDEVERGLGWRYHPQVLARLMRARHKNVVVARVDDELAGFAIMTYHAYQANLDLLAVQRPYRRNGVGTQLVAWLVEVAATAGIYNVYVQVRETNHGALHFYRDLGFERLDMLRGYYNGEEGALILAQSLRPLVGSP